MTQANIRTGGSPGAASTRACTGVTILSALEAPRPADPGPATGHAADAGTGAQVARSCTAQAR